MVSSEVWPGIISDTQSAVFHRVLQEIAAAKVPFAIGGGLAMAFYVGRLRSSKDLDIYIQPQDRDKIIPLLDSLGFHDYFDLHPYDRAWIYRAHLDDAIVDVIWSMANRRADVDEGWLTTGPLVRCGQDTVHIIPIEEMIWSKLYVLQRDRCDWPDLLNLIDTTAPRINWRRLLRRLGDDVPLLAAVLSVYCWLRPEQARLLPDWLWLNLVPEPYAPFDENTTPSRAHLLDSRPWLSSIMDPAPKETFKEDTGCLSAQ